MNIKYREGDTWRNILDFFYPVNSVYMSTSSESPAEVLGGTWTQKTGGLLALAGTSGYAAANATGGSLGLVASQLPAHRHTFFVNDNDSAGHAIGQGFYNTSVKIPFYGWNNKFSGRCWTESAFSDKNRTDEAGLMNQATGGGILSSTLFRLCLGANCLAFTSLGEVE